MFLGCAGILLGILLLHRGSSPAVQPTTTRSIARTSAPEAAAEIQDRVDGTVSRVSESPAITAGDDGEFVLRQPKRTTGSFAGRIVELDGSPIQSVWPDRGIDLVDPVGKRYRSKPQGERFVVRDLPLGAYTAAASAFARRMAIERIELTESRPDAEVEFRLSRMTTIAVTVTTPEGRPFRKALLDSAARRVLSTIVAVATRDSPGTRIRSFRYSAPYLIGIGEFWDSLGLRGRRPADELGILVLHAELPAYVSLVLGQTVVQTKRVEPGTSEVTFVESVEDAAAMLGSVRVRVLDELTSSPVEAASVTVSTSTTAYQPTDAQGEVTLGPVRPGQTQLICIKDGYAKSNKDLEIQPGSPREVIVRLSRPQSFEARVSSPDGQPCSATLGVMRLREPGHLSAIQIVGVAESGADGRIVVDNLERGIYLLADRNAGHRTPEEVSDDRPEFVTPNVVVDTTSGSPPPIEVRLSKAVTLWLRPPPADPVDVAYEITDAHDLFVSADRFDLPWPRCFRLAAGTYRVRFRDSTGKLLEEKEVSLVRDPVDVTFGPPSTR